MRDYYNQNAQKYSEETLTLDLTSLYIPFLKNLKSRGRILDLGCGPGRDLKYFKESGFRVVGIDTSEEMIKLATKHAGAEVIKMDVQDLNYEKKFEGIWACASLLHLPSIELPDTFTKISQALKAGGVFYCSFKNGDFEGQKRGRHFTNFQEKNLRRIINIVPDLIIEKIWITNDLRNEKKDDLWINCLCLKS